MKKEKIHLEYLLNATSKTIRNCYEKGKDSFGVFVECNV